MFLIDDWFYSFTKVIISQELFIREMFGQL